MFLIFFWLSERVSSPYEGVAWRTCYKMSVFRSRSPVVKDYTLYNQTLVAVQQHPYLGVLLSSDLRWNSHVDRIAKKGNSSLAFVKRNLYACSEETKRAVYVSLVRPHLGYATAVWDPYGQNQVEKLEAIQSSAVRLLNMIIVITPACPNWSNPYLWVYQAREENPTVYKFSISLCTMIFLCYSGLLSIVY